MVLLIGLHSRYRTSQVSLTGNTVTDDYYFVQKSLVILQCNLQIRSCLDSLGLITNVANGDVSTLICFKGEVTVEIGHRSNLCVGHTYGCTDNRFTLSIFHMAFDINLSKGTYG